MSEFEKERLLDLLEGQVDSGDLFCLFRDREGCLTLETRHGRIITRTPIQP
jgi:hypothetical protein